jgi:regulatory protein
MNITAIKQQVKRRDRYSIFVDGAYACSLSESGLLEQGLAVGQELDKTKLKELKAASGADKAYGNALRYVAMRPRSEWELATYLQRKEVDEPVAEQIIRRLKNSGLLDDVAFAQAWVANRRLLRNTSKRRLQLELKQKRVPEYIIDQALQEEAGDERENLRQVAAKKRARYPDQTKLMQYLARQGFSYDDIKSVLAEETEA